MTVDSPTDEGALGGETDAPTARRMILGTHMRRLREEAEISRADAGYSIRASESKISRLERGRVGFKGRDMKDLLTLYGVHDDAERTALIDLAETAKQTVEQPGWWHRYSDVIPDWFNNYVGLEESASRMKTFEHLFVPGLLQTDDYARSIMTQGRPDASEDEIERQLNVRRKRQRLLARPNAPRFWAVVDQSVLYRPIGGRGVLSEQLRSLLDITTLPNITIQILSYDHGARAAEGAFVVLRFAESELPTIVYIEHMTGALYLDQPDEVERYSRIMDRLVVDAESPDVSRQMISKRLADG